MHDLVKSFFKTHAPFEDHELNEASYRFRPISIEKNEFFCREGRDSDSVGFVLDGLLRSFYNFQEKETTTFFLQAGSVAVDLRSFLKKVPALENIQAVKHTELIAIQREDLFALYDKNWKWQQLGRVVIEEAYIEMEMRSILLQTKSAQERYDQFLLDYPDVIKTVPLHQIASYLGISPETLSRIRKNY